MCLRRWRRAGSDDRVVSGLRVGKGVEEDGGDGPTEGCGLSSNDCEAYMMVGLMGWALHPQRQLEQNRVT